MCLWHHRENSTVNTFNVTIVSVPAKHQKKSWLCESCTKYHTVKTNFHHKSQTVAAIICFKHKRKDLKFFKDKWPENTYWGMHVQWTVTVLSVQPYVWQQGMITFFSILGLVCKQDVEHNSTGLVMQQKDGPLSKHWTWFLQLLTTPCLHVFWLCWWWLIYLLLLSAWTEHCLQSSGYPFEAQLVIVTTKWNSFHTSCNLLQIYSERCRSQIIEPASLPARSSEPHLCFPEAVQPLLPLSMLTDSSSQCLPLHLALFKL
jgi:hypothetical protein